METDLQRYMRKYNDLEKLTAEFGIKYYNHPTLPLTGFKYNMIDSPKYHPVVRFSRGTVLEQGSWNIVAQPFKRFYNFGECEAEREIFDWRNFTVTEKVDGSLIILYNYEGHWHLNTSGSFGAGKVGFSEHTWNELFYKVTCGSDFLWGLNCNYTYMFELCTTYNKVVRIYPEPKIFFLGAYDIKNGYELTYSEVVHEAERLKLSYWLPTTYNMKSIEEILNFLHEKESSDPSFEGVVIRDKKNIRFKVKSESYIRLHHMADNGNIANPKCYVPFLIKGEKDEVLIHFPELKSLIDKAEEKLSEEYKNLVDIWNECGKIEVQKDFALAILNRTKFSGILFNLRKTKGTQATEEDLHNIWTESSDQIVNALKI